jgi:predicted MFS family arabinose efflux permease
MSILTALRHSRATALAFMVLGFGWGSFAALVPELKASLALDDAAFGRLLLASAGGLVLAIWLAPMLDRRFGSRTMPGVALALGFAFLLPALAREEWLAFALAMLVVGGLSGMTDVVMNVRVSEREEATGRSLMNLNHGMFSFAYAGGAVVAGLCREAGLPPVVPALGVAAFALAALRHMVQPVTPDDGSDGPAPSLASIGWPVALAGAIVLLAFMIENGVELWSALHIERTLGGRAAEGALGPAVLGLTMGVGRLMGQGVAERLSEARVLVAASAVTAVGLLLAAAAPVTAVAYAGFGICGLGVSVIAPMALALIGKAVPPRMRGRAIASAAGVGFLGFFIGPPLIGQVSESFGLRVGLAVLSGAALVVPVLLAVLVRSRRTA